MAQCLSVCLLLGCFYQAHFTENVLYRHLVSDGVMCQGCRSHCDALKQST